MNVDIVKSLTEFQRLVSEKLGEHGKVQQIGQEWEKGPGLELCATLISEETDELLYAMAELDREHVLKEAVDAVYVIVALCVKFGLDFNEAFLRVHENNMLKISTGSVRPDGKLVKDPLHPKVRLRDLV